MSATTNRIDVLYVDDEPGLADMAAQFLERHHDKINVRTATDPEAALPHLDDVDIDCIISDYEMPHKDGIEFLETVREDHPDLPFILFTGKGSEAVASDAISSGVTDYLQKNGGTGQYEVLANKIVSFVQKRQTEHELDSIRRQYTKLVEQNFIGIYIIQHDEFVYVNPRLAEIHGYDSPDEIIGTSPLEVIAHSERDKVRSNLERRLSGEIREIQYETTGLRQDGEQIDVELHGSRIEYEGEPAIIGAELDVTERKKRERALKEKTQQLEAIIQNTSEAIYIKDSAGYYQFINESGAALFGLSAEEVIGKHDEDLFDEESVPDIRTEDVKIEESGQSVTKETVRFIDGEKHVFLDAKYPYRDEDGEIIGLIGISPDVTELKEHERELQRKNELLDEFASVVAHDLRNPLTVVQGRVDLVQDECDSEHLDAAANGVDRSLELVENMLELARSGQVVSDMERIDMAEFVGVCWDTVETADAAVVPEINATIQADRNRLRQVLENLFRNAVEHGGDDVTVTVGSLPDGFYVADDGSGISDDVRASVFEADYTEREGARFGLSTVHQIVEAHGWNIRITENAETGTRFEIRGVEFAGE